LKATVTSSPRHPAVLEEWTDQKWSSERELWKAAWGAYQPAVPSKSTAIHEAGHAIAACRFRYGFWFAKLTFKGGAVVPRDYWPKDREYLLRRLIGNMAGSFAQARYSKRAQPFLHAASTTPEELTPHVRSFIREYWPAIKAFADLLLERGFVEHTDPAAVSITSKVERLQKKLAA
jgi:hypothetical protein